MKRILQPFIIVVIAVLLTACSKEKKIKRQLAGSWTITEVVTVTTVNNVSSTVTSNSETVTTFSKDGSGTASSSGSGTNPFPAEFTWSNTDKTLTIVDTDKAITTIYEVVEHSKDKIVLNNTSSETISGDTFTYDITITMIKK